MSVDMDKNVSATTSVMSAAYAVPRVNLLPDEILAERRLRRTQASLGAVVLAVVGAVAGGFVLASVSAAAAEDDLAVQQARTQVLTAEQAEYAEVPLVMGQVEAAQNARATAMSTDVLWHQYLSHLSASYPKGVWVREMTAAITPADPAAVASGLTTPAIGSLVVNGSSPLHTGVSDWMDVVEATPGLTNPMYTEATRTAIDGTVVVEWTSEVDLTPDALSNRYEIKAQ